MKYPKTVAAVKSAESSPWNIGDALCKECPVGDVGKNTGAFDKLKNVADEIKNHTTANYTVRYLRVLRQVANTFAGGNRFPPHSWTVHQLAGTPEVLSKIIAEAPKDTVITAQYVRNIVKPKKDKQKKDNIAVRFSKAKDDDVSKTFLELPDEEIPNRISMLEEHVTRLQQLIKVLRDKHRKAQANIKGVVKGGKK